MSSRRRLSEEDQGVVEIGAQSFQVTKDDDDIDSTSIYVEGAAPLVGQRGVRQSPVYRRGLGAGDRLACS